MSTNYYIRNKQLNQIKLNHLEYTQNYLNHYFTQGYLTQSQIDGIMNDLGKALDEHLKQSTFLCRFINGKVIFRMTKEYKDITDLRIFLHSYDNESNLEIVNKYGDSYTWEEFGDRADNCFEVKWVDYDFC